METTCQTEDGDDCIFPVVYNGKMLWTCTAAGGDTDEWCATEVEADWTYISGKKGYCKEDNCPSMYCTSTCSTKSRQYTTNV